MPDHFRYKKVGIKYKPNIIVPFGHRNTEFKTQGLQSAFSKSFDESVQKAEDFLRKKALGEINDTLTFFSEDIGIGEI